LIGPATTRKNSRVHHAVAIVNLRLGPSACALVDDMPVDEIQVSSVPLALLASSIPAERAERLQSLAEQTRRKLAEHVVWNVSSTSHGGGVAEMLQTLLAYGRGAGLDIRWLVIDGDPEFFTITKRLHNHLHGIPGDGGALAAGERHQYAAVQSRNVAAAKRAIRAGDIVLLHDPQTAGMVDQLRAIGAHVVWRCHIGRDTPNECTDIGWAFLRESIESADAFVFSRRAYVPEFITPEKVWIIPPSIDPFSAKNAVLSPADVQAALRHAGIVDDGRPVPDQLSFSRRNGSQGVQRAHRGLLLDGARLPSGARTVVQISRWDRLKDMDGVLRAFADEVGQMPTDVHLLLVGPDVSGVTDDPEGAEVLADCRALWHRLPSGTRARTHLCCLPMDDVDENAHLVNALQRYADVVAQKSLAEGFGLTVTEPMWKSRPVLASAVGGIQDQIVDGVSGLLLDDPNDLSAFARMLAGLLADSARAGQLGAAAHERVADRYLGDRHLIQYGELFEALLS
jgi:trehalose synthase